MLFGGDERNGFDILRKTLIRQCHAEFELEIREDAQAAHNDLRIDLVRQNQSSGRCSP